MSSLGFGVVANPRTWQVERACPRGLRRVPVLRGRVSLTVGSIAASDRWTRPTGRESETEAGLCRTHSGPAKFVSGLAHWLSSSWATRLFLAQFILLPKSFIQHANGKWENFDRGFTRQKGPIVRELNHAMSLNKKKHYQPTENKYRHTKNDIRIKMITVNPWHYGAKS